MGLSILRDTISNSYDNTMDSYLCSEEYKEKLDYANKRFIAFRKKLTPDQQDELDSVLGIFNDIAQEESIEALCRGWFGGLGVLESIKSGDYYEQHN